MGGFAMQAEPARAEPAANWLADSDEGGRVVVVDDEPDVCETLADYLAMHGFAVSVAHSGVELRK